MEIIGYQRQDHDAERCSLRKHGIVDCSRAQFLVMVMDYYFIKKHTDAPQTYCCPFLKCRVPFACAVDMVEHIKICPKFDESEMWCPACDVWGTYPTSKSGSCSWKKHSFAEKMLKPIKSISGHMGYKPSGRRSPSLSVLVPSKSPSPSVSATVEIDGRSPTSDMRLSNGIPAEIDSQCVIMELHDGPDTKSQLAEMEDWSSNTSFVPEMASPDRPTASDHPFTSNSQARALPREAFVSAPAVPLIGDSNSCRSLFWNERLSPYDTQQTSQTSQTFSSMSTYQSSAHLGVSPTSTMGENPGRLTPVKLLSPPQPEFSSTFTESPVDENISNSSLSYTNANADLDSALSAQICETSDWLVEVPNTSYATFTQSPETILSHQHHTKAYSDHLSSFAPEPSVYASLDINRRMSVSNVWLPEPQSQDAGFHQHKKPRPSPCRSLPVGSKMIECDVHDCHYTYKESDTHNYLKHRSRNHKEEEIFRCGYPGCERSYKNRKDNLQKHQRISHHSTSNDQVLGVKGDGRVSNRKMRRNSTKRVANTFTSRPIVGSLLPT